MSRVFLVKGFVKFVRKNRINDSSLLDVIDRADLGIIDAKLQGCLVKLRIARDGEGKSGGYRTIVAFRTTERSFFLYGFAKNVRENIDDEEQGALEDFGTSLLNLDEQSLAGLIVEGKLVEIRRED